MKILVKKILCTAIVATHFMVAPAMAFAQQRAPGLNSVSGEVKLRNRQGAEIRDRSDVVVFLDGMSTAPPAQDAPKISHKGMQFAPRVLPVVRGQKVDFLNDDGIFHNVFSLSKAKPFDLGIYPQGASRIVLFDAPGLVKIYCNIHPDMVGNILVLNNDRYALTDASGRFEIEGIPDGRYLLRVWHESSAEDQREIEVSGGIRVVQSFDLHVQKTVGVHKNKFGKPYDRKY